MKIILDDDTPQLVSRLIDYCYFRDFTDNKYDDREEPEFVSSAYINAQMYALGDKYDIAGLKELAAEKFIIATQVYYPGVSDINVQILKELTDMVDVVYSSTPGSDRRLRDETQCIVWGLWSDLSQLDEFKNVLCSHSDLILDVVEVASKS